MTTHPGRSLNEEPVNRLMTEPVLSVEIDDRPSEVFRLLTQYKVHHLPVVRDGCLVGMISSADLMKIDFLVPRTPQLRHEYLDSRFKIESFMHAPVVTTGPATSVEEAARLMVRHGVHALPIVGAHDRLLGIITTTDIMSAGLHSVLGPARAASAGAPQAGGRIASDEISRMARDCERLSEQVKQLERIRVAAERYLGGGQDERLHAELTLALRAAERPHNDTTTD
ncbi:MAG TPA: CBS domain-containing protein [Steroidobacteraceae bacterium]